MEEAKTARPINFRKTERSKYAAKVWTAIELKEKEMEEMTNLMQEKLDTAMGHEENGAEMELEKLKIGKKDDNEVKMGEIASRSKGIKKRGKKKFKSYKIVNF